jgi:formate dehydrogenase subunit gamma
MTTPHTLDTAANIISHCHAKGDDLMDMLNALQNALGFVPPPCIALISEVTGSERASIYKAIELAPSLSLKAPGEHLVYICCADNCCSKGGLELAATAKRVLGVDYYQCDAGQRVRIEPFRCLANCVNGPNVMINNVVHGPITPQIFEQRLKELF